MKSFKEKVELLKNKTENENVITECNRILEIIPFSNENLLRKSMLENLSIIELDNVSKKFYENEKKIEIFNNMDLEESFKIIFETETFKKNIQLQYPINSIYKNFKNGVNTLYIAESLVELIKPFNYDPQIEKVIENIDNIFENYAEDIDIIKSIYEISSLKNYKKFENVISLLEEHFYEKGSRRALIEKIKIYSFEPIILETMKKIAKYDDKNSLFLINENSSYDINNVYSFVYMDPEINETMYFQVGPKLFKFDDKELNELTENEILALPETFKIINRYIQNGYVKITENNINILLNNSKINFVINENGENKAYLNNILINGDIYKSLMESKMFNALHYNELQIIKKVWENLDTLINIDIAQEIKSKTGFSKAIIFKVNETFHIQKLDPLKKINEVNYNLNGLQLRNSLYEFLRYDISERLFDYLEGPAKEIGKLKDLQIKIQEKINLLVNKSNELQELLKYDKLIDNSEVIEEAIKEIDNEISSLKNEFFNLDEKIKNLQNINEESNILKIKDVVRIKDSGIIGQITAINTVTKEISILSDEGDTLSTSIEDVEKIDNKIATTLNDIEQKAQKVNKLHFSNEKAERAKKLFGNLKINE